MQTSNTELRKRSEEGMWSVAVVIVNVRLAGGVECWYENFNCSVFVKNSLDSERQDNLIYFAFKESF